MTLATELGGPSTVTIDAVTYKAIGYGAGFYWQTFGAREARFSYDKAQCKDDGLNRRSNGIRLMQTISVHITLSTRMNDILKWRLW